MTATAPSPDLQRIVEAMQVCRERYWVVEINDDGVLGVWDDEAPIKTCIVATGTENECLAYIDARCAEAMVRAIVPAELVEASRKAQAGVLRPGPYKTDLLVDSPKGGDAKLFDVRGLGFYTGKGHGALGLDDSDAADQMDANADFAAAAWNLVRSLSAILGETQPGGARQGPEKAKSAVTSEAQGGALPSWPTPASETQP